MDIDTDFEFLRKDDVLKEEAEDYGYDCFAKIETFGTMKAKNVLKGCAKVSGIENHASSFSHAAWILNPDISYVNMTKTRQNILET